VWRTLLKQHHPEMYNQRVGWEFSKQSLFSRAWENSAEAIFQGQGRLLLLIFGVRERGGGTSEWGWERAVEAPATPPFPPTYTTHSK